MDLSLTGIQKKLQSFRGTKWFDAVVLVILGLIAVGLYSLTSAGSVGICLGILLTPVSMFVIPYWLGERRLKRYALNFVPVAAIAVVLIAALSTQAVMAQGAPQLSSGELPTTPNSQLPSLTFWNGTSVPFTAPSANGSYRFEVRLKNIGATNLSRTRVWVNVTEIVGLSQNPASYAMFVDTAAPYANTTNGTWYVAWVPLAPRVYGFYFYANRTTGNASTDTFSSVVLGPLIAPWTGWYGVWLVSSLEYMVYPGSFYFVLLFMYWYTVRTRKMRARLIESSRKDQLELDKEIEKGGAKGETAEADKAPEAKAATWGRTKKAAAFTCTNCGADVTEDDTKCPKCGAVFEG